MFMTCAQFEDKTEIVEIALSMRTGDYWYDVESNVVYTIEVLHCIMDINSVSYYRTGSGICLLTKYGYIEVGILDEVPYCNKIFSPYGDFVKGKSDRLRKCDHGSIIILDIIGDLLKSLSLSK